MLNYYHIRFIKPNSRCTMDPRRLILETNEMRQRFPQFTLIKLPNGRVGYKGTLRTRSHNNYEVLVIYPDNYPYEAPKVYLISPRVFTKHQFRDCSICYYLPHEWSPWYTVCTAIGWVAHWLHAYEHSQRTGHWPGREVFP